MKKINSDFWLRIAFAVYSLGWGIAYIGQYEFAVQGIVDTFGESIGNAPVFVIGHGILYVSIAVSLVINFMVRYTSLVLFGILLIFAGLDIYSNLIAVTPDLRDIVYTLGHLPFLAAAWAIFARSRQ